MLLPHSQHPKYLTTPHFCNFISTQTAFLVQIFSTSDVQFFIQLMSQFSQKKLVAQYYGAQYWKIYHLCIQLEISPPDRFVLHGICTNMRCVFNMRWGYAPTCCVVWVGLSCTDTVVLILTVLIVCYCRNWGLVNKEKDGCCGQLLVQSKMKKNTQIHLNVSMLPETRWTHCGTLLVGIDSPATVVVTLLQICF